MRSNFTIWAPLSWLVALRSLSMPTLRRAAIAARVGLWCALVVPVLVMLAPAAPAQASPGQCTDIEALFNITLTDRGRNDAQVMVRSDVSLPSPYHKALCLEFDWDCTTPPAHADANDAPDQEAGDCGNDGDNAASQDDCDSTGPESFNNDLLAERAPQPDIPLSAMANACFDSPSQCNALPPLNPLEFASGAPVPALSEPAAVAGKKLALIDLPSLLPAEGLRHARGVTSRIDHPPR